MRSVARSCEGRGGGGSGEAAAAPAESPRGGEGRASSAVIESAAGECLAGVEFVVVGSSSGRGCQEGYTRPRVGVSL